jgi:hypothetical protein
MKERTFIVCVQVSAQDVDLLEGDRIPQTIRRVFEGGAIRVIECEPEGEIRHIPTTF